MQKNRTYYEYSEFLKNKYGEKVYKLPVSLPVTCPNRADGIGCFFCAPSGTGFEAMEAQVPVSQQLEHTRSHIRQKYKAQKYIAYFQNYTNTYLPLHQFKEYMLVAAGVDDIVEIAVSTRPDCIPSDYLMVLKDIRERYQKEITIELGLQTANYHTLEKIHRGHTLAEFIDAVWTIRPFGFDVCTHVILNLPGDTMADCIETAKVLSALRVQMVKVHSLYVAKNTPLCESYENGTITLCSKEEYIERLITFLEYLNPDMVVERLFSRIPEKDAAFCNWGTSWWKLRDEVLNAMKERDTYQGRKYDYLHGAALSALSR